MGLGALEGGLRGALPREIIEMGQKSSCNKDIYIYIYINFSLSLKVFLTGPQGLIRIWPLGPRE